MGKPLSMTKAFPRISLSRSSLRLPLSHLKLKGMATLAAAAARQLATSSRISTARTSSLPSNIIHRRGLAGAADHHGPPRVNVWQDPLSPSKWKEEHFVIVSLSGWGLLIFGGYKFFTGGKGKKEENLVEAKH
ncbi:hypothetical protein ACFX13_024578 [Malus domestica]|uniref:Uncharacterized protein n=2 Tax=Malus TaxID=3749 RepID=A0A498HE38_MALDO|nr:hypothetical protein DVH24_028289 [Malus domestica]